jgi:serine/threonine protein phosphatase PrpC
MLSSGASLAVTRALGDAEFEPYVLHTPEVRTIELAGTERFLLVASDGFWEPATKRKNWRHSLEDRLRESPSAENAINMIHDSLSDRNVNDNCTLVLAML